MDIDGEPIAVQRIELVGEGTDTEGRGSICGEHSRKGQSRTARFSYGVCQPNDKFRMESFNGDDLPLSISSTRS
jgi:hypothetical protein